MSTTTKRNDLFGNVDVVPYEPKKGEKYMGKKMLEHFRSSLNSAKERLMLEVDRTVQNMQLVGGNFPDPNDRATQESELNLELRTRERERMLMRKIENALQKIETKEYGYCKSCGEEIGLRRLEARPTAILCIDCKTLEEIREKQQGTNIE